MFNVKKFLAAAEQLGIEKNIAKETIKEITIEALERAYIRILTGNVKLEDMPDPRVKVVLDTDKGTVDFYQIKTVKEDVTDDMLEIDLEDAVEYKKNAKYGDDIEIHDEDIDADELNKIFIKQFKNVFHIRLNDAEKSVLYDTYKDHIGEIIIGTVEKVEERAVTVNIGKNSVYLSRKDMIGDETFTVGQQIKLFLADQSTDKKGSISVTRSDPGFLKRLFEEEIHEIYDGTIVIKGIARKAGKRSKVAVYSNDRDVDATGSCIGKDGSRINKVVNQLGGNGRDKEKIDIVAWSENPSLYIIDALRPAEVVGINIDKDDAEGKEATCIVKDGQYSKAIGLRGINVRLAVMLTGYDLTILEETAAKEEGLKYTTKEELDAAEALRVEEARKAEFAKHSLEYKESKEKEAQEELKKVEANRIASHEEAKAKRVTAKKEKKDAPISMGPVSSLEEELAKARAAASKAQKKEAEHVEIKTTTSILDLEKQLEEKKEEEKKANATKSRRPRKITEEELPNEEKKEDDTKKEEVKKMDIYTEEELRQMEEEENENVDENYDEDEDIDYDDYDEYYDDEK